MIIKAHTKMYSTPPSTAPAAGRCRRDPADLAARDAAGGRETGPVKLTEEALKIHRAALLIDGHNDLPQETKGQGSIPNRIEPCPFWPFPQNRALFPLAFLFSSAKKNRIGSLLTPHAGSQTIPSPFTGPHPPRGILMKYVPAFLLLMLFVPAARGNFIQASFTNLNVSGGATTQSAGPGNVSIAPFTVANSSYNVALEGNGSAVYDPFVSSTAFNFAATATNVNAPTVTGGVSATATFSAFSALEPYHYSSFGQMVVEGELGAGQTLNFNVNSILLAGLSSVVGVNFIESKVVNTPGHFEYSFDVPVQVSQTPFPSASNFTISSQFNFTLSGAGTTTIRVNSLAGSSLIAPVPEPSTFALLGAFSFGAAAYLRRRKVVVRQE